MSIINLDSVSFRYGSAKNKYVIKTLSLDIEEGEFIAIIGHNGSGKSTLAKLLNGLLQPTEGVVTVDGNKTSDDDKIFDVRKTVGVVFQNPDNQMVATIIEDDVAFGPENIGVPREEIIERVNEALEAVGMSEYRKRSASKLSGGQKQRVLLSRALAGNSEILILDDSSSALDYKTDSQLRSALREQYDGITTIVIAQRVSSILHADHILVLDEGKEIGYGTHEQLMESCAVYREISESQMGGDFG